MKNIKKLLRSIRVKRSIGKNRYLENRLHWIRFCMQEQFGSAPSKDVLRAYLYGDCANTTLTDEQKEYLFRSLVAGLADAIDDHEHLLEKVMGE